MLIELPFALKERILDFLDLQSRFNLAKTSKLCSSFALQSFHSLALDYRIRQKLRAQTFFDPKTLSLPSHFTHILLSNSSLKDAILYRPNSLKNFRHLRSSKAYKLHHPYFYRQLPLVLSPNSSSSHKNTLHPVLNAEDIPLPHDLSLIDIFYSLLLHARSLTHVSIETFDSSPLPWNSTPSRVCPRDILHSCRYDNCSATNSAQTIDPNNSKIVCVWCPDCKPAQHEHTLCWRAAGGLIRDRLLSYCDEITKESIASHLRCEQNTTFNHVRPTTFTQLESMHFRGWAVSNFISILRIFGCQSFPCLKTLSFSGTVIMAPSLTMAKDARPRPKLINDEKSLLYPGSQEELNEKLSQLMSFHLSPFARRYLDTLLESYWMAPFNGIFWTEKSFPELRSVSLRLGAFDDACRWIIPLIENVFSKCTKLHTIELEHSIPYGIRPEDALIRLFTLRKEDSSRFPALTTIKLKLVNSPILLLRVQDILRDMFGGRPLMLKTRKLYVKLNSADGIREAELIRNWASYQNNQLADFIDAQQSRDDLASSLERLCFEECKSIFSSVTDGSAMLILNFDPHDPSSSSMAENNRFDPDSEEPFYFGNEVSKVLLKHFTPSLPSHQKLLNRILFCHPPSVNTLLVGKDSPRHDLETQSTTDTDFEYPEVRLKRVVIQLELPQVWQIAEEEAKQLVTNEVETLRRLLRDHPHFQKACEIRVSSCTRLTYGGTNWAWWEKLICGDIDKDRANCTMTNVEGCWARESKEIISTEELRVYRCPHVWTGSSNISD